MNLWHWEQGYFLLPEIAQFEQELRSNKYNASGIKADASNPQDTKKVLKWISGNVQTLDILVYNAGINIRKKALDYTPAEYQKIININLIAPLEISRQLHPYLSRSTFAAIINIASVAALQDVGTGTPYAMAIAGLLQQTRSLALEWAGDGIRVNAVSPWFTVTPLTHGLLTQQDRMKHILERTPLKRVANANEIASIVAFLAMYITGQKIIADGGMSINAI